MIIRTEAPKTTADNYIIPTTRGNILGQYDPSWDNEIPGNDRYIPSWSHGYQNPSDGYETHGINIIIYLESCKECLLCFIVAFHLIFNMALE